MLKSGKPAGLEDDTLSGKAIVIFLFLLLSTASPALGKEWRGLAPLRSTCEDVKRILGIEKCETGDYILKDEEVVSVHISISKHPCDDKWPYESYNVPPGTVTDIIVTPRPGKYPRLTDLGIDLRKYEKAEVRDTPGYFIYDSKADGFSFNEHDGEVIGLNYFPSTDYDYLLCPGAARKVAEEAIRSYSRRTPYPGYGDLAFDEEKKYLDDFALKLRREEPETRGYIIAYAGRRAHTGEAQARAERAKNYLVCAHGLAPARLVTVDAGYREELTVELYIRRKGSPPPLLEPTLHPSEVQIIHGNGKKASARVLRP